MRVATFTPRAELSDIVAKLTIVETSDAEATRILLPGCGLIVGARYSGGADLAGRAHALPDLVITGVQGAARTMRTRPRSGIVLATFRAGGAAALFREPLHEIHGDSIPLDALAQRDEVTRLGERVAAGADDRARVAALEEFLLTCHRTEPDRLALAAVRAIEAARGAIRIADLARSLGVSQDPLEKRFRRAIGATPKQVASLVRVRRAIEIGAASPLMPWSRVALEAGYFDQSHFIREFRAIVGEAPARFFKNGRYC